MKLTIGLLISSAVLLTACGSDDVTPGTNESDDTAMSSVRVTHASADAPMVEVKANGETFAGLSMVDYRQGSAWVSVASGSYDISVDAILPGDNAEVIAANLEFSPDMQYDIIALNNAASLEPVVLSRSHEAIDSGSVRIDVLHGHPGVGGVDVYLTTAAEITSEAAAITNLEFKVDSADLPVTVPADTYRIRITVTGDKTVVFDSGEVALAGGSDLMLTAVPNVDTGAASPVNLLLADGSAVSVVRDMDATSHVRAVHAVDDAPMVDVLASGTPVSGFTGISFKDFQSGNLPADTYDLSVAASADNSLVVIDAPGVMLEAGAETSIYAVGKLNAITDNTIEPLVIAEDLRSVALYSKIRVVHASPTAGGLGLVDIHASTDGNFSADTAVLSGVDFKGNAVLNVPGGSYTFAVILASDMSYTPAVSSMATVENGAVYSAVATDDFSGLVLNVDTMAP
ncbi:MULTISPECIES: DUF4397 domain-containing protein [unclassified Agarivorans]|uniref:DUF4397 domain-containing protein n=1 Tax=unclassified Agarivorans TaxID=2636026 RepID=UPI0026E2ED01|nr:MULTISPECIES: DUF4397 domain-containing protein [unclassified Agarivorans]MDO6686495.1 DUF4397 domain-containing protein [Agarivorans sp. 3_MG-2023]MDO6715313.1 DUF4397 domain-containing protein [Agarivorans sp. 2_MG-2023]